MKKDPLDMMNEVAGKAMKKKYSKKPAEDDPKDVAEDMAVANIVKKKNPFKK